jgi:hypothetical protein
MLSRRVVAVGYASDIAYWGQWRRRQVPPNKRRKII